MQRSYILLGLLLSLLLSLLFSAEIDAQDIDVRGRQSGVWNTINDGDMNPNQAVTDFGNVNFGNSNTRKYRIRNNTNHAITIRGVDSNNSAYTIIGVPSSSFSLPANNNFDFDIRFRPTTVTTNATITVRSTAAAPANFYTFAITGNGQGPDIQVRGRQGAGDLELITPTGAVTTQNGTSFGTRMTGASFTNDFLIENVGNTALNLGNASIIGADAAYFELDLNHNPNIQGGGSRSFEISAGGATPGTYSATVSIPTNDFDEDPFTFPIQIVLIGRPLIEVAYPIGGQTYPVRNLREHPDSTTLSLADTTYGESRDIVFQIHNPGNGELSIDSITSSESEFSVVSHPSSVAAGQTRNLTIRFTPSSATGFESFFTINNNSRSLSFQGTSPYTFRLKGEGIPAPNPAELRVLSSSGGLISSGSTATSTTLGNDFGNHIAGDGAVTKTFVLQNSGDIALEITKAETSLGSLFLVTVPSNFPITIAPGDTSLLRVRGSFRRNPDTYTETLSLSSNDPVNPTYTIPLSLTLEEPPPPVTTSFVAGDGKFFLSFSSALGVSYVIEQSTTLEADSWEPVLGFGELSGSNAQTIEIPRPNGIDRLFYRIARPQ